MSTAVREDSALQQLQQELTNHLPTCRRGDGFADVDDLDAEVIRGIAVPYGKTVELFPGLLEKFERGVFARQTKDPRRVKLCLEHGQVIGRVDELTETDDGLRFSASIAGSADIPEARRARALLAEKLVDELSIGFNTVAGGSVSDVLEDGQTLITHKRARLLEVSLVPWGAYGRDAKLSRARLYDLEAMRAERARAARIAEARAYAKSYAART